MPTKEAIDSHLKPRVPINSFVFEDKYNYEKVKEGVLTYEKEMKKFRIDHHMDYLQSYCVQTAFYSKNVYFRKVEENYNNQGFLFKD